MPPSRTRRTFLSGLATSSLSLTGLTLASTRTDEFTWTATIGNDDHDRFTSVVPAHDGGWLLAGTNDSSPSTSTAWLVAVGSDGDVRYERFPGPDPETRPTTATELRRTADGYLLGGTIVSSNEGNGWMAELDANGCITSVGTHRHEGVDTTTRTEVVELGNGGAAMAGAVSTTHRQLTWVAGFGPDGEKRWTRYYESNYELGFLLPGREGSCVVGGTHLDEGDVWLVGISADGEERWRTTVPTQGWFEANDAVRAPDGGYTIAGCNQLLHVTVDRDVGWQQTYDATVGGDPVCLSGIERAPNGGYAFAGENSGVVHLGKADADGTHQWTRTYSESVYIRTLAVDETGTYALAGATKGSSDGDGWIGTALDEAAASETTRSTGTASGSPNDGTPSTSSGNACSQETPSFSPSPTTSPTRSQTLTPTVTHSPTRTPTTASTAPGDTPFRTETTSGSHSGSSVSTPGFGVLTTGLGMLFWWVFRTASDDEEEAQRESGR